MTIRLDAAESGLIDAGSPPPAHTIKPSGPWPLPDLAELWEHRELAYFLVWREIRVRYKQTVLGLAWAVIQPFFTMVVFSVFFGHLGKLPSDGLPYPIFAYAALLPWQLFSFALTESTNSVVTNQRLITKVYFPRLIIPLAAVLVGLADFVVAFGVLGLLMAYYGIVPGFAALTVPLWTLLALATAFGVGLWLSALNVRYRDVRYTLPFLTQLWMFASPIAYSSSLVPPAWRPFYALNPLVGVVDGFRWALLGRGGAPGPMIAVSIATVVLVLVSGVFYFQRTERTFADIV
jgi:homopolymeric O-antigen transport system permease protein